MLSGTVKKEIVASLLAPLMEVVRTTMTCESVAMVIKALIWMQSPQEIFAKVKMYIELLFRI